MAGRLPGSGARRALLSALVIAMLAGAVVGTLVPRPAPAGAAPAGAGKYYIVGQPVNGQREYLYDIARKTLGNGNRYREIVDLNRGRREPDGRVMADSMDIRPGWVLLLPPDANGPGVMTGSPPQLPTSAPPTSAAAERATTNGGGLWSSLGMGGSLDTNLLRIGGFAVAFLLLVLAIRVLRGGARRPALAANAPPPAANAPAFAATAPSALAPARGGPQAARWPVPPGTWQPVPDRQDTGEPEDQDAPQPGAVGRAAAPVAAADHPMWTDDARPPLPNDPHAAYVREELDTDAGPVSVRLAGVAAGLGAPAFAWLADDEKPPPATVPLVLGRKGRWSLLVDLARTPDVVTIVGSDRDCRRQAAGFARQLRGTGLGVAVVNGALGDEIVPGVRALDRFPDLPAAGDSRPEPHVVFSAGAPGATARRLVTATEGRAVPVIIGNVPDGRWSIRVGTAAAEEVQIEVN